MGYGWGRGRIELSVNITFVFSDQSWDITLVFFFSDQSWIVVLFLCVCLDVLSSIALRSSRLVLIMCCLVLRFCFYLTFI